MRRLILFIVVLIATALGAETLAWRWAAGRVEAGFSDWVLARRAEGWIIAHGPPSPAGWPLRAELVVPDVTITPGPSDMPGGAEWSSPSVRLSISLAEPHRLTVSPAGPQRFRAGSAAPIFTLTAGRFDWHVPLDTNPLVLDGDLSASDVRIAAPGLVPSGAQLAIRQLGGRVVVDATAGPAQPPLRFVVRAQTLDLPPPGSAKLWPLGNTIAAATIEGTLNGPLSPRASPAARAAAWRDHGGMLAVRVLALDWGDLRASGTASMTLDAALQPVVDATTRLTGFNEALATLVANHVINPGQAQAAKAVLGLMATSPAGGGPPEVEVPLSLRDGILSAARFPLGRVTRVDWAAVP